MPLILTHSSTSLRGKTSNGSVLSVAATDGSRMVLLILANDIN
jgi:hypothetical protein